MDDELAKTIVVLHGQIPDTPFYRAFRAQLEERVGDISVVWIDGGPYKDPLYVPDPSLPLHKRTFGALNFEFQNTLGFHQLKVGEPVDRSIRDKKLNKLRRLHDLEGVDLISVTLPYSDHPHRETQRRLFRIPKLSDYDNHVWDGNVYELTPNNFLLPAGSSFPKDTTMIGMAELFAAKFYWSVVQTDTGVNVDTAEKLGELVSIRNVGKANYSEPTQDTYECRGFQPLRDLEINQLFSEISSRLDGLQDRRETNASLSLRLEILELLHCARDYSNVLVPGLEKFQGDPSEVFYTIDTLVHNRLRKDPVRMDWGTVPVNELSKTALQAVATAQADAQEAQDRADRATARLAELREQVRVKAERLADLKTQSDQVNSELDKREAAVAGREAAATELEALLHGERDQKVIDDTELISRIAQISIQLDLIKDDQRRRFKREAKRLRKSLKAELEPYLDRLQDTTANAAIGTVSPEAYANHSLSDAVLYIIARRAIEISKSELGLSGSLSALDVTKFLKNRYDTASEAERSWYATLGKQTPSGTADFIMSCIVQAAIEEIFPEHVTFEDTQVMLRQIHFTETGAVLDPSRDPVLQVEIARQAQTVTNTPAALTTVSPPPNQALRQIPVHSTPKRTPSQER